MSFYGPQGGGSQSFGGGSQYRPQGGSQSFGYGSSGSKQRIRGGGGRRKGGGAFPPPKSNAQLLKAIRAACNNDTMGTTAMVSFFDCSRFALPQPPS